MVDGPNMSPAVRAALEQLEHTGLAVEMVDAEWRLIWISPEMRTLLGGADDDEVLNVGVHWGGGLCIGQVVTGGRLEVTALGDEVNECARIEQTASKGPGTGIQARNHRTLADIDGTSEKTVRDAGAIAVTDLRP